MIRGMKKVHKDALMRLPDLINAIGKDYDVSALYIFGSFAQGQMKPLSDLDFAVLLSSYFKKGCYSAKHLELLGIFNHIFSSDEIDLVLLNNSPFSFCYNILKHGKLVYCRNKKEVIDFRERLTKSYLDFRYFRDKFDQSFLDGVGYHG